MLLLILANNQLYFHYLNIQQVTLNSFNIILLSIKGIINQIQLRKRIMNQTKYKKVKTKRNSAFYDLAQPSKPVLKKLLTHLSQSYEACHTKQITNILENRHKKLAQMRKLKNKYIWQSPMIPPSLSSQRFNQQQPLSIGEKYLIEKVRDSLIVPDRAFNSQPNVKGGSIDKNKMMSYDGNQDKRVISQKFEQFVRIVDEQSGTLKRKRFSVITNESNNHSLPVIKSPYKISMKKTYFKKFPSDQYNFYKPPIKQISRMQKIFDLTSQRQSTDRSRSIQFNKQKQYSRETSPGNYRTLQISLSRQSSNKNFKTAAKTLDAYRGQ